MKRNEWSFQFAASKVLEAAQNKREEHQKKFVWWENKLEESKSKAKDGGIVIQSSLASSYSNTKSGFGPQVSLDPEIQKHLSEAFNKVQEHNAKVKEYQSWIIVLGSCSPSEVLELNQDDYLYFFNCVPEVVQE